MQTLQALAFTERYRSNKWAHTQQGYRNPKIPKGPNVMVNRSMLSICFRMAHLLLSLFLCFSSKCVINFYFIYMPDAKIAPNSCYIVPITFTIQNFFFSPAFKGIKLHNFSLRFFSSDMFFNRSLNFNSTTREVYSGPSYTPMRNFFLRKWLTAASCWLFLQKRFMIDVWLGCKYASVLLSCSSLQNKNEMVYCFRNTPSFFKQIASFTNLRHLKIAYYVLYILCEFYNFAPTKR